MPWIFSAIKNNENNMIYCNQYIAHRGLDIFHTSKAPLAIYGLYGSALYLSYISGYIVELHSHKYMAIYATQFFGFLADCNSQIFLAI